MVQEYVQIKELTKHDLPINLHFTRNNESLYTRYKTDLLWPITPTCRNAQDKSTPRIKTTINSWQLPRKKQKNHPLFPHLVSRPNDNREQKQAGQTNGTTRNNQKVESKGGAG